MKRKTPRLSFNDPSLTRAFGIIADHIDGLPEVQRIRAGNHILLNETPSEIIINGTPAGSGGGGSSKKCPCPLEVKLVSSDPEDPDNENKSVEVGIGAVNNLLVTGRDDAKTDLSKTAEGYVVIKITMSGAGQVTEAKCEWRDDAPTGLPVANDTVPSTFDIPLAYINEHRVTRILGCFNFHVYPRITCINTEGSDMKYNYGIGLYPS